MYLLGLACGAVKAVHISTCRCVGGVKDVLLRLLVPCWWQTICLAVGIVQKLLTLFCDPYRIYRHM